MAKQHEEFGVLGLWPIGRYWADPCTSGMTLAHDMLEHFPRDDGTVEGELMALGAALYVRDGDSYFSSKGNRSGYEKNIGGDAYILNTFLKEAGRRLLQPLPNDRPLRDPDIERQLAGTAAEMRRVLLAEGLDAEWADGPSALNWLRRGYRRAAKRYHGIASFWMMCAFSILEKKADYIIRYANEFEHYRFNINPKHQIVTVDELGYPNY